MRTITSYRACKILYNILVANNIRKDRSILVPANICPDIVKTIQQVGANIRYADISTQTLCISEKEIMNHIAFVDAILLVHTYGVESDFSNLFATIKAISPKVLTIDDKCLCFPMNITGSKYADITLFSTGSKKQYDIGKGGLAIISDRVNYERYNSYADFLPNEVNDYYITIPNTELEQIRHHKSRLNAIYQTKLPSDIQFPDEFQNWRFNIWVNNKAEILDKIFSNGLFASSHYQPQEEGFPNSQKLYSHVINLFNDKQYTEEQAEETCNIINSIVKSNNDRF